MLELKPVQIQTQQLKMTTELRQAISLLQYSTQELADYIREQAIENPLIELSEPDQAISLSNESFQRPSGHSMVSDVTAFVREREKGLEEELLEQVSFLILSPEQLDSVTTLIFYLDEDGYLREDLKDLAHEINKSEHALDVALHILQGLDPAGIAARNLQECLVLQIKRAHPEDTLAIQLVANRLEALARQAFDELACAYDVPLEEIERVISYIKTLNPRPGRLFEKDSPVYIQPDVVVEHKEDHYEMWLVDGILPKISYNAAYYSTFMQKKEATAFLRSKYKDVQWLMRSIEQRQQTLLKVTEAIMNEQHNFLIKGYDFISPLTLKDIAGRVGVHESTVSRTVRYKYVQTPQGVFELRSFFSSGIKSTTQPDLSAVRVKNLIKDLITEEDKSKPLSDQAIVTHLQQSLGLEISRRTVTKYRQALNIPSSSKRKLRK